MCEPSLLWELLTWVSGPGVQEKASQVSYEERVCEQSSHSVSVPVSRFLPRVPTLECDLGCLSQINTFFSRLLLVMVFKHTRPPVSIPRFIPRSHGSGYAMLPNTRPHCACCRSALWTMFRSGRTGSVVSGSPAEESQGDGVDLALQVRDSPDSLSSRFWIFNVHQAFNSSTKDI